MKQVLYCVLAGCVAALSGACAGTATHPAPDMVAEPTGTASAGRIYRETGSASWYGIELQGMPTASGEIFDLNGLTAAHRTLPFGTVVRVTNLDTFKSVTLTVNDRGPFIKGRVIETSLGAAHELGFAAQGTARVRIESLEPVPDGGTWTVNAAVFAEEESARLLRERLTRRFEVVSIVPFRNTLGKFYRVRVGAYSSEEKAERIAAKLTLDGLEPVVVRKD